MLDEGALETVNVRENRARGELPDLDLIFQRLENECPGLIEAIPVWQNTVQQMEGIYTEGMDLSDITLLSNDIGSHGWNEHVIKDFKLFLMILPAFLVEHPEYDCVRIMHAGLGMLVHDLGLLLTEQEKQAGSYSCGAEKYFAHVQLGVDLVPKLLPVLLNKPVDDSEIQAVQDFVLATEFNFEKLEGDELSDLFGLIDVMGYLSDRRHVPIGAAALYQEFTAAAQSSCEFTARFFQTHLKDIAKGLKVTTAQAQRKFEARELTIADLRFPGDSLLNFVTGDFIQNGLRYFPKVWDYLNKWYGSSQQNLLWDNLLRNVARARAIQQVAAEPNRPADQVIGAAIQLIAQELTPVSPEVNDLVRVMAYAEKYVEELTQVLSNDK
ncbi:hypothetical protein KKD62_02920 [Patescibacteria group bacterium]|nr:hypothetical protein [Patescibacteria group bacterium]MBU1931821.1 hypothetical protein [Patescibacteria group bacterium]